MNVPQFVRDFMARMIGRRIARVGFTDTFAGTIQAVEAVKAETVCPSCMAIRGAACTLCQAGGKINKRLRYEVLEDNGQRRFVYADEPGIAHLEPPKLVA